MQDDDITPHPLEVVDPEKPLNPVGRVYYGPTFKGFHRVGEMADFIPQFKEFYYERKILDFHATHKHIIQLFNKLVMEPQNKAFHPYTTQYKSWYMKWDRDILEQKKVKGMADSEQRQILQVINTRNDKDEIVLGGAGYDQLEEGMKTLGGELLNDAVQMLRDDQALEELYDGDVLMKRRKYIVDVFGHVTKLVHGKANLMLKASAEKRETASFMMTLLAKAQAGTLSDEEMERLKMGQTPTKVHEHT